MSSSTSQDQSQDPTLPRTQHIATAGRETVYFPRSVRTPQILSSPPQSGRHRPNNRKRPSQGTYASRPSCSHDSLATTRFQQKQPATGGYRGKMSAALIGVHEILHQCVAIPMIRNEAPFCVRGIRQLKTIGVSHGRGRSNRGT